MEYLRHSQTFCTAVRDFDFADRIKPSALLEYLQEIAVAHATQLGVGYDAMCAKGLCWVLNRVGVRIERSPRPDERITAVTYPHKPGIADAVRDYLLTDKDGNVLVRATSRWCVLNIRSRAVARVAPLFAAYPDEAYDPAYALEDGNIQLPPLAGDAYIATEDKVRITDLDRNGHMNNARYGDIAVNSCDHDYYATHTIRAFYVNFLSELKAGDRYRVRRADGDGQTDFEAEGSGRAYPVFRARIEWQ